MAIFDQQVHIDRPIADVFAFMTDPSNQTTISSSVVEHESEPPAKGARGKSVVRVAGKRFEIESEITEFVQNERVASRSTTSPIPYEMEIRFTEEAGGTRVDFHQEAEDIPSFWGKLAIPVVTRIYSRAVRNDMESVKDLLEA